METKPGINMGRYRGVVDRASRMHWAVVARLKHTEYQIRARHSEAAVWYGAPEFDILAQVRVS